MVKADWRPWKEILKGMIPMALIIAVGDWVLKGTPLWQALLGGCGFVLFLGAIRGWKEFKQLRQAEKRRQAAASGAQWFPLASPQPYPDPEALPLPFVISSKPDWWAFLAVPLGVWIVVTFGVYFWFWSYVWPNEGPVIHTLALTLALTLAISTGFLLSMYHWIEVDEEGLTIRNVLWSRSIAWHEARLFAVDAALKADNTPNHYELSSATSIVRWLRVEEPSGKKKLSNSSKERIWQMKAVHSVIAARTGLLLYDLREGMAANVPQAVPSPLPPRSITAQP